jgi:hypothetical protein
VWKRPKPAGGLAWPKRSSNPVSRSSWSGPRPDPAGPDPLKRVGSLFLFSSSVLPRLLCKHSTLDTGNVPANVPASGPVQ